MQAIIPNFIKKTMDEWISTLLSSKGFYMIMDNSPIYGKNGDLKKLIESRGYKCIPLSLILLNSYGQS